MPLARHVVFDLDGVIVDSEPIHEQATDEYLASLGIPDDEALRQDMMGRRVRELTDVLAKRLGRPPQEVSAEREALASWPGGGGGDLWHARVRGVRAGAARRPRGLQGGRLRRRRHPRQA